MVLKVHTENYISFDKKYNRVLVSLDTTTYLLEKEMATHSSVPAWRVPGTGEPGGLWSMGSHKLDMTEAT